MHLEANVKRRNKGSGAMGSPLLLFFSECNDTIFIEI